MICLRKVHVLGLGVGLLLSPPGEAQVGGRAGRAPQRMGSVGGGMSVRAQPSRPPIRMGSLPQPSTSPLELRGGGGGYYYGGHPIGGFGSCYGSWCRRAGSYGRTYVHSVDYVYVDRSYVVYPYPWYVYPIVYYGYPVYTTSWSPGPAKIWTPGSTADTTPAAAPADPTKSRMLTVGGGVDGGGGVMRVETLSDSVARVTWLGTTRPIRDARVFLADSVQQSLRGALIDHNTPSALLKIGDLAPRVAYVGLTITLANGAIETTLIPYDPRARQP
ncbi:MAG: hypothetical protein ACT4P6_03260 [Gemmatimonadaceae bacterium]